MSDTTKGAIAPSSSATQDSGSQDHLLGTPRPLWRVMLFSVLTGLAYYGYYKWMIQDELHRYTGKDFSGAVALLPFVIGVTLPPTLATFDPDVPSWFAWFFVLGVVWIYIVQFRLYRTVNQLYRDAGLAEPLELWWLFIPGLNLLVGLRQIHFLSQYWMRLRGETKTDPVAEALPLFFAEL
ncbi:hypothetical protein [Vacuolonema iberomarrocanum]|uniref:hypothetical protein n=1 Tax=Vacuolonema iberomarrocanum TaxID=3454632 RepID=UPI003F6E31C9